MSRVGNAAGLPTALALLAVALLTLTAQAQSPDADDAPELEAPLLDRAHARAAHRQVERWLLEGAVEPDEAEAIPVTGALGVRLTLWRDGLAVGTGQALRPDAAQARDNGTAAVDLTALLADAADDAFADLDRTLQDAHRRAGGQADRDVPTIADVATRVLVDVQIAYNLEPVRVEPDQPTAAVYDHFAPGYHGLRIAGADRTGLTWPGTALARNVQPASQLRQALNDAGYRAEAIEQAGRPNGVPLERFRVRHVVRPASELAPVELVRGHVLLPPYAPNQRTLEQLSDRIGDHLHSRFTRTGMVRGTYLPTSDRYAEPPVAEPADAALASYALLRHTRYAANHARRGRLFVQDVLDDVTRVLHLLGSEVFDEDDAVRQRPGAAALTVLTLTELPRRDDADRELRDRLGGALLELATEGVDRRGATGALMVASLAALWEQTRQPELEPIVAQGLSRLHARLIDQVDLAALPWLMIAHNRAAHLLAEETETLSAAEVARREDELGALGNRLAELQIVAEPRSGPADVIGGFDLTGRGSDAPPTADWRSAQVLMFLAAAMRQPELTADHDPMGWMLTTGLAGRFVGQLTFSETNSFYVRSRSSAHGGVRLAPWDNRLTVDTQGVALIAMIELLEAMDELDERW